MKEEEKLERARQRAEGNSQAGAHDIDESFETSHTANVDTANVDTTNRVDTSWSMREEHEGGALEEATAALVRSPSATVEELTFCQREWKARLMQVWHSV
jgi:hypothetical protein